MAREKLTKTKIDRAEYPAGGRGAFILWDTTVTGFGLRVHPSGEKAFVLGYRYRGKYHQASLGRYGDVTFDKAQGRARELREGLLLFGRDPAEELRRTAEETAPAAAADVLTLRKLGGRYLAEWAKPRKRSWKEDERYLKLLYEETAAAELGKLGDRAAAGIGRRELRELLRAKAAASPIAANRLLAVVRRVYSWALEEDLVEASPCANLRPPAPEVRKERVLSAAELGALWRGLSKGPGRPELRRALQLVLVTAQRPGEVIGAGWEEFGAEWWTIPSERAKNGKAHRVPLGPFAREILAKPDGAAGPVFPSEREEGGPIEVNALAKETRKQWESWARVELPEGEEPALQAFTPHDLRRTAASHMTGLGVPRLVVSRILNHAEGGVTSIYDRHSYDTEKREALLTWEAELRRITSSP